MHSHVSLRRRECDGPTGSVMSGGRGAESPGFGITDHTPKFDDEVIREPECLKVRVVDGLREVHRVDLSLSKLPDLSRFKNII